MSKADKVLMIEDVPKVLDKIIPSEVERIQDLPKPARQALVKHMHNDLNYTYRQIVRTLGIGTTTAQLYINSELDDAQERYKNALSNYFTERNATLKNLTSKLLEAKIKSGEGESLRDVTQLYKVLHEVEGGIRSSATNTGNMIAINVHPAVTRDTK